MAIRFSGVHLGFTKQSSKWPFQQHLCPELSLQTSSHWESIANGATTRFGGDSKDLK